MLRAQGPDSNCSSSPSTVQSTPQIVNSGHYMVAEGLNRRDVKPCSDSSVPVNSSSTGKSQVVFTTNDKFELKINVTNFAQNEINVKVVDNSLVVEGKHDEKEDKFGFVARQFTRRFILPEGVILEKMTCRMIADNIILISAPRAVKPVSDEKSIPINFVKMETVNP